MTVITAGDREMLHQLLEDVREIENQFLGAMPKPAVTRTIFVPILRRWVAEGLFHAAQKLILPRQVRFSIRSNADAIKLCKAAIYEHWMATVLFDALGFGVAQIAPKYQIINNSKPPIENNIFHPAPQNAKSFFEQRVFFWKSNFYTRADVIKMHANALGGVHFDFRRTYAEPHIIEIKNYIGLEVTGKNMKMLIGDDIDVGRADLTRRKLIYDATELVAIDTARIFASGVRASWDSFTALLA